MTYFFRIFLNSN